MALGEEGVDVVDVDVAVFVVVVVVVAQICAGRDKYEGGEFRTL